MIILKANSDIKNVFLKMINTMGENVKWTELFIINNNDIILAGTGRSLFFNFDNRRALSNIVELPIENTNAEPVSGMLMENALNMVLYAFGKWGGIKGLKVEQNYDQLNRLINKILYEIDIEANLSDNNFRFYQEGIQITYEEVIQLILDRTRPQKNDKEEENSEEVSAEEEEDATKTQSDVKEESNDSKLGLWHTIQWSSSNFAFQKVEISEQERIKERIGNNFYMVSYKCPTCEDKLHMIVYPIGKEFRVETEIEPLYMARAYTCRGCNSFFTPKPHMLLVEGDVFYLTFEDDRRAYEDYLELLGNQGERTSNSNFNVYESEYLNNKTEEGPVLDEIVNELTDMTEEAIARLKAMMDSGFYPEKAVNKYSEKIEKEYIKKQKLNKLRNEKEHKNGNTLEESKDKTSKDEYIEYDPETYSNATNNKLRRQEKETPELEKVKAILKEHITGQRDMFQGSMEALSTVQMKQLKVIIKKDNQISQSEKTTYVEKINGILYKELEKEWNRKIEESKTKPYVEIVRILEQIKDEDCEDSVKQPFLHSIMELLNKIGQKELEHITNNIPENINRKQYDLLKDKIAQYKEIDQKIYKERLEEKRDIIEKQEIAAFIKRARANDRRSYADLYQKLKNQNFSERNVAPYLEKIHDKLYDLDEQALRKICPEPADLTFEEGLLAQAAIQSENFLPELKLNMLTLIDKRLRKIKMDECEQLVRKFKKECRGKDEELQRIYYYDVRKMNREDNHEKDLEEDNLIIQKALETYADEMGPYEYPLVILDTSKTNNGKTGFLLTPDHIFYNNLMESGKIKITDVVSINPNKGLVRKGIYAIKENKQNVKIAGVVKTMDIEAFAEVLHNFVEYLKEKPASRSLSYLAKEKHVVKCCYRCGYVFQEGDICPKCGSKYND